MNTWKTTPAKPEPQGASLDLGRITLSIKPSSANDGTLWQHALLTVGEHTDRWIAQCQQTWPRQALRMLREAIDEAERELDKEGASDA